MKLYADTPALRTRQLAGDLLAAAWIAVWVWLALELGGSRTAACCGRRARRWSGPAARSPGRWARPVTGSAGCRWSATTCPGRCGGPAGPVDTVAEAGRSQQQAVEQLALWLPLLILLLAAGIVLARRLPARPAWAREAGAATPGAGRAGRRRDSSRSARSPTGRWPSWPRCPRRR